MFQNFISLGVYPPRGSAIPVKDLPISGIYRATSFTLIVVEKIFAGTEPDWNQNKELPWARERFK